MNKFLSKDLFFTFNVNFVQIWERRIWILIAIMSNAQFIVQRIALIGFRLTTFTYMTLLNLNDE